MCVASNYMLNSMKWVFLLYKLLRTPRVAYWFLEVSLFLVYMILNLAGLRFIFLSHLVCYLNMIAGEMYGHSAWELQISEQDYAWSKPVLYRWRRLWVWEESSPHPNLARGGNLMSGISAMISWHDFSPKAAAFAQMWFHRPQPPLPPCSRK